MRFRFAAPSRPEPRMGSPSGQRTRGIRSISLRGPDAARQFRPAAFCVLGAMATAGMVMTWIMAWAMTGGPAMAEDRRFLISPWTTGWRSW